MSKKIIIHIDGVQGSGKSYICSKLKNILCIDTDDIRKKALDIIDKTRKTDKKMPRTFKQLNLIKKRLIKHYIRKNKKIVFVGMTANIPEATHKFFIEITDHTIVYKRLLLRELKKIIINYTKIKKHIKEENNPFEIDVQRIADMSVQFPVNYDAFLSDYNERLEEAKINKYTLKTQEQIISIINDL